VGSRDAHDGAIRARRRRPERVALTLDDQRRDRHGVELREAALVGLTGWVEWEGEADDGDRVGLGCCPARDAGARRAAAGQDREAAKRTLAELEDDQRPGRVELPRWSRAPPLGDPVGLLYEHHAEPYGNGGLGCADEIGRLDSAAGPVAEHEPRYRRLDRT
jgi:hypothetical protein